MANFGLLDTQTPGRIAGDYWAAADASQNALAKQQSMANQNALAQMQLQQAGLETQKFQRQMADDEGLKAAYRASEGDMSKLPSTLLGAGYGKQAIDFAAAQAKMQKELLDAQKIKDALMGDQGQRLAAHAKAIMDQPTITDEHLINMGNALVSAGVPSDRVDLALKQTFPLDNAGRKRELGIIANSLGMSVEKQTQMTTPDANTTAQIAGQAAQNAARIAAENTRAAAIRNQSEDHFARTEARMTEQQNRGVVQQTPEGYVLVDPRKGTATPVLMQNGEQVQQKDSPKYVSQKLSSQLSAAIPMARKLIPVATSSGIGSAMDSAANFFGQSTEGADAASQLETLAGWMTSNVPRMQGPQSDKDVLLYRQMAAQVGDRTKPASQRLKALDTLEALQAKYSEAMTGAPTSVPPAPTSGVAGDIHSRAEAILRGGK